MKRMTSSMTATIITNTNKCLLVSSTHVTAFNPFSNTLKYSIYVFLCWYYFIAEEGEAKRTCPTIRQVSIRAQESDSRNCAFNAIYEMWKEQMTYYQGSHSQFTGGSGSHTRLCKPASTYPSILTLCPTLYTSHTSLSAQSYLLVSEFTITFQASLPLNMVFHHLLSHAFFKAPLHYCSVNPLQPLCGVFSLLGIPLLPQSIHWPCPCIS